MILQKTIHCTPGEFEDILEHVSKNMFGGKDISYDAYKGTGDIYFIDTSAGKVISNLKMYPAFTKYMSWLFKHHIKVVGFGVNDNDIINIFLEDEDMD